MSEEASVERSHEPSEEELSKAVSDVVLELRDPAPSPSVVLEEVLERQAHWNVSEEQVAKYVDDVDFSEVVEEDLDEGENKELERSPPRRPQRTLSTDSLELTEEVLEIVNMDDAAIMEEADKRSSFILKGGSHSIQKVLRGTARDKKDVAPTRFDRRKMRVPNKAGDSSNHDAKESNDAGAATQQEGGDDAVEAGDDEVEVVVDDKVLEALHGSYNEPLETGSELEFEHEVERRSKFIAKGGMHSIKKVLDGNARSSGKSGPTRFDRRRIARNESSDNDDEGTPEDDDAPPADAPPKPPNPRPPTRQISVDSTDSFIEDEANRRSKFMVKGASHSIRQILEGTSKKEPTVNRFDRRKMHFKKESDAIHYTEKPHATPQEMNDARLKEEAEAQAARAARKEKAAPRRPRRHESLKDELAYNDAGEPDEGAGDADEALVKEADRRSQYMVKGGSHSIRKLFAGSGKKTQGINRFDRRKMHFKKESEAVHYAENHHLTPDEINKRHQEEAARLRGDDEENPDGDADDDDDANSEDDDEDDLELLAEADSRSMMMLKGASHSIRNIFSGKSKKKENEGTGMTRRLSHFKKEGEKDGSSMDNMAASLAELASDEKADEKPDDPTENDGRPGEEPDLKPEVKPVSRAGKAASHAGRFSLRGAKGSIKTMLGRKGAKKISMDEQIAILRGEQGGVDQAGGEHPSQVVHVEDDNNNINLEEELADDDREIEEEADKRSAFIAKGASYSIQKVLSGKARQKKGSITRLDRRKMHFKHESDAMHSHDQDPKTNSPAHHHRDSIVGGDSGDDDDDENRDIEEEADRRSSFMAKGASYSIQKVLTGKARQKKDGITRFDRRKMHFKHEAEAIHSHDQPADAPAAAPPKKKRDSIVGGDTDDDLDDEERELEEEADKRSAFMAKGASYSIQKVLAGKHRKKTEGVTRFDRRKMHFKKESADAADSQNDLDTPAASQIPHAPQRKLSDDATGGDADVEDSELLADADGRSPKGGSHSIRSMFTGKSKKGNEGATRLPQLKKAQEKLASPSASGTSVETSLASTKDPEITDDVGDDDLDEDVDLRKRFSLKGASHSIKKVLAGKARRSTTTGVTPTRFDRRKMHFKKPGNKDEVAGAPGGAS